MKLKPKSSGRADFRFHQAHQARWGLLGLLAIGFAGLAGLTGLPKMAAADDWPQWLGPQRDGISKETDWNPKWAKGGPKVLWSAQIGSGFSSVAVSAGRAYTMGNKAGMETLFCFDAATGQLIWAKGQKARLVGNMHAGGPSATPTIDGKHVYTLGKDGKLICFEASTGKQVWIKDLVKELNVNVPEWGFCSSPLILGEALIVQGGATVAFKKADGKLMWKSRRYKPAYGSSVAFKYRKATFIASLNTHGLAVVDSATGRDVAFTGWTTKFSTNSCTPLVVGDRIFISTGYGKGCGLFSLKDAKLSTVYTNTKMANHFNNSVLVDGHLYGFDGNGHAFARGGASLVCMELATGKEKWRQGGMGCGSLMVAGKTLIILSDFGELVTAEATTKGFTEIARAQILGGGRYSSRNPCWTMPVIANGRIYARDAKGLLVCLDVSGSK